MRSNRWRRAIMLAILSPVLVSVACTDADDLAPQTQSFTVFVALTDPDPRFELVEFKVGQVMVNPLDPDAAASLTADGLVLFRLPLLISSLDTEGQISLALTNGAYSIDEIRINSIRLRDFTPDPAPSNCIEYFNYWSRSEDVLITADDLVDPELVIAENGGTNSLGISVNSTAFATAFVESWDCSPCGAVWCLGAFHPEAFTARAPEYLTLE